MEGSCCAADWEVVGAFCGTEIMIEIMSMHQKTVLCFFGFLFVYVTFPVLNPKEIPKAPVKPLEEGKGLPLSCPFRHSPISINPSHIPGSFEQK